MVKPLYTNFELRKILQKIGYIYGEGVRERYGGKRIMVRDSVL